MLTAVPANVAAQAIARAQESARQHVERPAHVQRIGAAADELMRFDGDFSHGDASCFVEWARPLPQMARWVRAVHTMPASRGQGHATRLMRDIAARADALGIALVLEPKPEDDVTDAKRLERWYRGLGFQTLQRDPVLLLVRAPVVGK